MDREVTAPITRCRCPASATVQLTVPMNYLDACRGNGFPLHAYDSSRDVGVFIAVQQDFDLCARLCFHVRYTPQLEFRVLQLDGELLTRAKPCDRECTFIVRDGILIEPVFAIHDLHEGNRGSID